MENHQQICDLLLQTLQATRAGSTIESLEWDEGQECVFVYYHRGIRVANCACDSGLAMIKDILKVI